MEQFNQLKAIWNQQAMVEPALNSKTFERDCLQNVKAQKAKHYWTITILAGLIILLAYYYSFIYTRETVSKTKGLALMILVIIARCALEIAGMAKLRSVNFTDSFNNYNAQLIAYYHLRKITHFFFTPAIYILYIIGFISLLPLFKERFSNGFYLYVLISGCLFLVLFSFLLFRIIKKDLSDLNYLQKINQDERDNKTL
jgi:hypothetical protein